ncbi:MAG TPA: MBL fold metallo-hydrolase [Dactylosporangium sp.]|jgi:glyoxylase-like metal-dependent hydrolase (beta-lactamase superfamily II)|nr:MBL fold metallo-hydrolase [Dactylosporangium sp.]
MTTGLEITKLSVGPMDNNAYLLRCRTTGDGILIDAANEAPKLLRLVEPQGIAAVVTTHRHPDHWMALQEVLSATGAESLAHPADAPEIPVVTSTLTEGDTVTVGDCTLEVIHLVGHTPGSIALYYAPEGGHLFTGDSLFPGGVGNTHGNKADFDSLFHDVTTKIFDRLPDDVTFYPGHGRNSTLGTERPSIPEWRARGW